jgi:hypothetical protein
MSRALLIALGLMTLSSCGGSDIDPASGTWTIVNAAPSKNTCGDSIELNSGTFTLMNNGDGTFIVEPMDATEAFDCTLDGESFECPKRLQSTVTNPSVDAAIEVRVSVSGTFASNTEASGTQYLTAACTGTQCDLAAGALMVTFPCEVTAAFNATFKE